MHEHMTLLEQNMFNITFWEFWW